jgi:hypothetical protein
MVESTGLNHGDMNTSGRRPITTTFESLSSIKLNRFESFGLLNRSDDDFSLGSPAWKRLESSATAVLRSLKLAPVASLTSTIKLTSSDADMITPKPQELKTKVIKKKHIVKMATVGKKGKRSLCEKVNPVVSPDRFPRRAKESTTKNHEPSPFSSSSQAKRNALKVVQESSKTTKASKQSPPRSHPSKSLSTSVTPPATPSLSACSLRPAVIHSNDYTILTMTNKDVLSGRGNGIAKLSGNIAFRKLVFAQRSRYAKCLRHKKSQMAQDIIDQVHAKGGRFLEKLEHNDGGAGKDLYRVMEPGRVLEKTSQALRERCSINKRR